MSDNSGHGRTVGDLAQEILDRLVADPDFRQMLLDRPEEVLASTGYPVSDEVSGYGLGLMSTRDAYVTTAISCPPTCIIGKPQTPQTHPHPYQ